MLEHNRSSECQESIFQRHPTPSMTQRKCRGRIQGKVSQLVNSGKVSQLVNSSVSHTSKGKQNSSRSPSILLFVSMLVMKGRLAEGSDAITIPGQCFTALAASLVSPALLAKICWAYILRCTATG